MTSICHLTDRSYWFDYVVKYSKAENRTLADICSIAELFTDKKER